MKQLQGTVCKVVKSCTEIEGKLSSIEERTSVVEGEIEALRVEEAGSAENREPEKGEELEWKETEVARSGEPEVATSEETEKRQGTELTEEDHEESEER
ncbi:hypothetical protein NDU88_003902 [Pleurodeles waltl]|uniref:Uncharacterized protein n=1 Tax=Pleurodeles waltl TaxID=8319 RepID=A0AAV7RJW0_PLEWA|nr:hypothetical protein NDU88_003902 [Pleurodeles waltl]